MTNAFGVELDSAGLRRVAAEGVPETVIAAIYLLHERSVDEIASKLRPDELGHVVRLVGRCPSCYPPGTLDALQGHGQKPLVADAASSGCPAIQAEPSAEDLRRERCLARLRAHPGGTHTGTLDETARRRATVKMFRDRGLSVRMIASVTEIPRSSTRGCNCRRTDTYCRDESSQKLPHKVISDRNKQSPPLISLRSPGDVQSARSGIGNRSLIKEPR
jgi:hypothetical protein